MCKPDPFLRGTACSFDAVTWAARLSRCASTCASIAAADTPERHCATTDNRNALPGAVGAAFKIAGSCR
eukprot:CAMPEP_0202102150 /NCGR_PEP_ID=MMETSP0965-20130614/4137_1 /ASSEMBLY_ACC=CAM_ASM_000507 /TAXON_ID=4773 /ORGANISM="Schizochytrium aggregatum, Strain ATCC28209" /LENGTH=68 /DNA_ID=CAMNT_0048670895 /DNA_START=220 /DNA_END=422 /DNA_ORIENTATION=-